MESLRRILVVVDPTVAHSPAIDRARRLAEAFRCRVTLAACLLQPPVPRAPFVDQERLTHDIRAVMREPADRCLDALCRDFRALGVEVDTQVAFGAPLYESILREVAEARPDLVVKDTHHHSRLRRTLLANTDWHLIRECPVPLLLVKSRSWAQTPRIAAAVDPGHPFDEPAALDHAIVEAAERLARGFGTAPLLLHFWSPAAEFAMTAASTTLGGVAIPIPQALMDASRTLDEERLGHLARVHDVPPARVRRLEEFAGDGIVAFAERETLDVVALGAVSRSGLGRVFIGSTAERVLETLPCDALVVRAPPRRAA